MAEKNKLIMKKTFSLILSCLFILVLTQCEKSKQKLDLTQEKNKNTVIKNVTSCDSVNEIYIEFYSENSEDNCHIYHKKNSPYVIYNRSLFSIDKIKDSFPVDKLDKLNLDYFFNTDYCQLENVYSDNASNGLVRNLYFISKNKSKKIRIIGKTSDIDSLKNRCDYLLNKIKKIK